MGMGLLVGVWVARYLGPEQFGLFNYATAVVALFAAIATLGLNNIVVRGLVRYPEEANSTLGTAFVLQLIGGVLSTAAAVIAVSFMRPDDTTARITVSLIGSAIIFKATDVIRYWFEARIQSKYIVWVENAAFLVFAAVKVGLMLIKAPLLAFVWIVLAESVLVAALLIFIYTHQDKRISEWRCSFVRAKSLLQDSWPLILSGLAAMLYMRIDQIMLGQMLGDEAVGIYSAATRISEIWYFVPISIVNSVLPEIIRLKSNNDKKYLEKIQSLYDILISLSIIIAITITLLAPTIINILYGEQYGDAATILSIQIWAGVFVTMGVSRGPWVISEGLQKYTYRYFGMAMIVNVISNSILIPKFGPIGASISSIAAQATTALIAPAFFTATRPSVLMLIKSINIIRLIGLIRNFHKSIK